MDLTKKIGEFTDEVEKAGKLNDGQDERLDKLESKAKEAKDSLDDLDPSGGDNATLKTLQDTLGKLEGRLKTVEAGGGGGVDAQMLQMVKADVETLKTTVGEVKAKADKFDGRIKAVEDGGGGGGGGGGLKGKIPVIPERDKELGIWTLHRGRLKNDWDFSE